MNTMTTAGWITGTIGWLGLAALIALALLSYIGTVTRRNATVAAIIGLLASTGTWAVFVLGMAWAGGL